MDGWLCLIVMDLVVAVLKQSGFYENREGLRCASFQAQETGRCARPQDNPPAAVLKKECQIHTSRTAVPRRRDRT